MRKTKHPLSRAEIYGIVKRFVKPEAYVSRRDIPLFYKVFEQYPDAPFWRAHDLGFELNCIAWFLSDEGKAHLTTAIALYHLDMTPPAAPELAAEKTGADAARPEGAHTARTVSDLLR